MPAQYRHNHYVPVWYQKRFLLTGQQNELHYLNLQPAVFRDNHGNSHMDKPVRRLGLKKCFAEDDLYTTKLKGTDSTFIEQHFFGQIDHQGQRAVEYWGGFAHPWDGTDAFQELMMYMSTQKLRTPKGLGWLAQKAGTNSKDAVLRLMLRLQQLHCAIWTESVWLLADASNSPTKFIVSDHPVTVYNRRCGPRSDFCRGFNDPDIWLNASQTIFPLSLDKALILTNLSWVRNPYQSETALRPNPNPLRNAMFKFTDIQTLRSLTEREVHEINFIIKSRALRYVAAAQEDWLFPERHVSKSDWARFGHGYLLMPDPRSCTYSGEIIIGHRDGTATGFDEYGRRPWEKDYGGHRKGVDRDWETFHRFQGEFARLFGPHRRGRSFNFMRLDNERDDDDFHQYHLSLEKRKRT